ncbi:MAG TPA: cytochrome c [Xanthobacteraceae bacterium]
MVGYARQRRAVRVILALLLGSLLLPKPACAQLQKSESHLTLRAIMQELGVEHVRLTNALLTEDFETIAEAAKAIEGHPLPDDIVAAIKARLGSNFSGFERADLQSHQAAAVLARRATAKDITGSATAFGRLTQSCVSCHKQFRGALRSLSD